MLLMWSLINFKRITILPSYMMYYSLQSQKLAYQPPVFPSCTPDNRPQSITRILSPIIQHKPLYLPPFLPQLTIPDNARQGHSTHSQKPKMYRQPGLRPQSPRMSLPSSTPYHTRLLPANTSPRREVPENGGGYVLSRPSDMHILFYNIFLCPYFFSGTYS